MSTTTAKKTASRKALANEKAEESAEVTDTTPQDHPFASIFDPWIRRTEIDWTNARNANALSQASAATMKGAIEIFQETGRFFTERLKKDMETMKSFTACRTGEDYFRVQADFIDNALRDYADETAKVAHMAADVTQSAAKPLEDRTKEALHSVAGIPKDNGQFA